MCGALYTKILTRSFSPSSCYLESIFQMTFFCIFFLSGKYLFNFMVPVSNLHSNPQDQDCMTPGEQNVRANSSSGHFSQFPTPLPVLRKRRSPHLPRHWEDEDFKARWGNVCLPPRWSCETQTADLQPHLASPGICTPLPSK